MLGHDDQTIIAQCTPKGSGAVALLRMSGQDTIKIADKISKLASGKKLSDFPSHTIQYGWIVDEQNNHIDQVLFLIMHAPKTFTGQNTIEVTCHNNPFIIEQIIERAITAGARISKNGEFTKRALLNDKIDLIQAEAVNELIHANTAYALKQSLAQVEGSFSKWISTIEKDLVKALAFAQASFEFIDEEDLEFGTHIKTIIQNTLATTDSLKKTFDQQQQIRQGIRIAIIGSVNAGKSSLFNTLLNKDRAIVTNIAGTTRDSIEAGLYNNGNYWTLIDTAGLRQSNDVIEQIGIKRSFEEAQQADIILLVLDQSRTSSDQEYNVYNQLIKKYINKIILIRNKSDLPYTNYKNQHIAEKINKPLPIKNSITISIKTKENIYLVEHAIQNKIDALFQNIDSPFLLNQRQFNLLLNLEQKLREILPKLNNDIQYELLSYHLNDALTHLSELTGKSISKACMDAVFRNFCVGK